MIPTRIPIDIQINLPGKPGKVMVNGVDYSHTLYLLIEITPGAKVKYLVGTLPPKEKQVEEDESN